MNTKKLLRKLANRFPKRIREGKDPIGLQTGKLKEDTNKILLCLDFDEIAYETALKEKPDLILTHHPFIYGTKNKVFKYDENKKTLCDKIDSLNIPVYSMHTNFDSGKGGMNDALAEKLELIDIHVAKCHPMMRGGSLKEEMDVYEFAKYSKNKLGVDYGLLLPHGKKSIKTVAIIGGGGWGFYKSAMLDGYDIYISGDIPHHGRRGVISYKFNYLDLPHEIEKVFMEKMAEHILAIDDNIKIIKLDHEKLPEII